MGEFSRDFGRYVHQVRTEVLDEPLRAFGKRVGLSASYLGKIENAEVAVPKRETVLQIAQRLGMPADPFLVKAGYVPESPQRTEDDEYLLLLIGMLTDDQRRAARVLIKAVADNDILVPQRGDTA